MTSDDTINKYIRDVLVKLIDDASYLVIKADQNSPRRKEPYCTVKVMASKSASLEEYSWKDDGVSDTEITSKAMRSVLVYFNFFKNGALTHDPFYVAGLCRQGLSRQTVCSDLNVNGLGLSTRSQVRNTTFQLDSGFEERATVTASFNFVDTDSEIITTVESAEVIGTYEINGKVEDLDIQIKNN